MITTTTDQMVEDTANKLLRETSEQAVVEAAEKGEWPAKLWAAVTEAGLTTALDDGLDGLPQALAVAKATGAYPAPVPLVETILARGLAKGAGLPWPEGPATIAPPRHAEVKVVREGGSVRLRGSIGAVPFGRWCDTVAVPCDGQLILVPARGAKPLAWSGAQAHTDKAYSGEPLDSCDLDLTLPASSLGRLTDDADALGALMRCFQMAGALRQALAWLIFSLAALATIAECTGSAFSTASTTVRRCDRSGPITAARMR